MNWKREIPILLHHTLQHKRLSEVPTVCDAFIHTSKWRTYAHARVMHVALQRRPGAWNNQHKTFQCSFFLLDYVDGETYDSSLVWLNR